MLILGIDPGTSLLGWGIVEKKTLKTIGYGHISNSSNVSLSKKLFKIYTELEKIIEKYKPDVIAVEQLFFAKNVKTAISVGHARGVILLVAEKNNIPSFEYTPTQIKQAVSGYGRADKLQVQKMIKALLNLKEIPKPDDTADALAVAICHNNTIKYRELTMQ